MTDVRFIDSLCEYRSQLRLLAMVSVLSTIVLVVSLQYVEAGTATYVIAVVQIVTFGVIFAISSGVILACARRNSEQG